LIECGDVHFHYFKYLVRLFHFIENLCKHIFHVKVFRVSPLLLWLLTLMGWNVSFLVTITFLPISLTVTPFPVTVSPSIISLSIPTLIPARPWITRTETLLPPKAQASARGHLSSTTTLSSRIIESKGLQINKH